MASRTRQKEEARQRRLAEERARAERERRMRRLQMIGGVSLAAIAVVVIAIAISLGGGSSGLKHGKAANKTVSQVNSLLAGIPQSGTRLGNPNAPITMTYYGDLECPVCQAFTLQGGFSPLVQNEVRSGKVKVVYKAFATASRDNPNPNAFQTQQVAALAAGEQNRFWYYAELFYHEQGQEATNYVTENYLRSLAAQVPGLNLTAWETARNDPKLVSQIQADNQSAITAGVQGTPTLVFQGPKGTDSPPSGVPTYSDLQQAIKAVE